jgi:hypothetical protein
VRNETLLPSSFGASRVDLRPILVDEEAPDGVEDPSFEALGIDDRLVATGAELRVRR